MRKLYLDCSMGAAGDMLSAALLELFDDKNVILEELNSLNIPGIFYQAEPSSKCGIRGTHMHVTYRGQEETLHDNNHTEPHHHGHHHTSMHDIEHIVSHLQVSEKVRSNILSVYQSIASAESFVHGVSVQEIHFHEVGTMDAVADVTAVCYLMDRLNVQDVIVSPINVGKGTVHCAHGVLPVPAPATAFLLKGVPVYSGDIDSELCTPTGAALLKYYATSFSAMPLLQIDRIGYGMGQKDFSQANCVRAVLGTTASSTDTVYELKCNVDDMTAEAIGYAIQVLLEAGALDVFAEGICMKKSRPGTMITVLCDESARLKMVSLLMKHTTTLGIRESLVNRYVLDRQIEEIHTPEGTVRIKSATGYGVSRKKIEFDDLARVAANKGISLFDAAELVNQYK